MLSAIKIIGESGGYRHAAKANRRRQRMWLMGHHQPDLEK